MDEGTNPLATAQIMRAVGVAMVVIGLVWGRIIGFYESQRLLIIALAGIGALLAWFGQRKINEAKRSEVERRIAERNQREQ